MNLNQGQKANTKNAVVAAVVDLEEAAAAVATAAVEIVVVAVVVMEAETAVAVEADITEIINNR